MHKITEELIENTLISPDSGAISLSSLVSDMVFNQVFFDVISEQIKNPNFRENTAFNSPYLCIFIKQGYLNTQINIISKLLEPPKSNYPVTSFISLWEQTKNDFSQEQQKEFEKLLNGVKSELNSFKTLRDKIFAHNEGLAKNPEAKELDKIEEIRKATKYILKLLKIFEEEGKINIDDVRLLLFTDSEYFDVDSEISKLIKNFFIDDIEKLKKLFQEKTEKLYQH